MCGQCVNVHMCVCTTRTCLRTHAHRHTCRLRCMHAWDAGRQECRLTRTQAYVYVCTYSTAMPRFTKPHRTAPHRTATQLRLMHVASVVASYYRAASIADALAPDSLKQLPSCLTVESNDVPETFVALLAKVCSLECDLHMSPARCALLACVRDWSAAPRLMRK